MEATSDIQRLSSGGWPSAAGYTPLVPMPSRVLLIGWDGADWRILDPLLERGLLPNLAALIDRGGRATLTSTIPTHSWAAWPSFLTGVDPDGHGVYDILEGRGGTRQFPVTFRSIKERTFLDDLSDAGMESLVVNVPLTFPPPAIRGKLVAGGVLPKWRAFTHPEGLADELRKAGVPWPINGMSWTTYRNRPEPFLDQVVAVTSARQRAMEHLLDTTDWRGGRLVYLSPEPGAAWPAEDLLARPPEDAPTTGGRGGGRS